MTIYKYTGITVKTNQCNKEWYIVKKLDDYALCESTGSNYQQWFKLSNLVEVDK